MCIIDSVFHRVLKPKISGVRSNLPNEFPFCKISIDTLLVNYNLLKCLEAMFKGNQPILIRASILRDFIGPCEIIPGGCITCYLPLEKSSLDISFQEKQQSKTRPIVDFGSVIFIRHKTLIKIKGQVLVAVFTTQKNSCCLFRWGMNKNVTSLTYWRKFVSQLTDIQKNTLSSACLNTTTRDSLFRKDLDDINWL